MFELKFMYVDVGRAMSSDVGFKLKGGFAWVSWLTPDPVIGRARLPCFANPMQLKA